MYVFGFPPKYNRIGFHIKYGSYKYIHTHKDFWEFTLIVSGNYIHRINGESLKLKPRTLCIIRPLDRHALIAEKESECSHINIAVEQNYFKQISDISSCDIYNKLLSACNPSLVLSPVEADEIIRESNFILGKTNKSSEDLVLIMMLSIMKLLIADSVSDHKKQSKYGKLVSQIIELVSDKNNLTLNLKELIDLTGYSYHHANRSFLTETGQSLFDYFHIEKMLYAKTLLTNTDYTLDVIAQKTGYSTAFAFSAAFKKITGMPPSEYARTHQRDYVVIEGDDETPPPDL